MLIVSRFKVANLSQHTIFRLNGENLFLFSHLSYYFKSELGALNKTQARLHPALYFPRS